MGVHFIGPTQALSTTISGTTIVQTPIFDIRRLPLACFQAIYVGNLNATFQILGSTDGINFDDTGEFIKPATGSNGNSIKSVSVGFPYIMFQITPSSGSATVTVNFTAKEG